MGSGQKSMSSSYEDEDCCSKCITRIPYATLIALILNWVGVGVFCTTLYRGVNLTLRLTQDVFQLDKGLGWIEPTQLTFIILAASMAALALMILVVAILATGATRHHVYRSDVGRAGGRIATMMFIFITYLLLFAWIIVFACCIVMTIFYTLSWGVCNTDEIGWDDGIIDFYPYHFLFPQGTQREHMEVKGPKEIKAFCKDYVERAEVMFIMATLSCVLVILSLVHFLMALSANYAHIRGHDKFTELQEMHDLQSETMTLTERVLYK
ncbi:neuronal membrane glycoprotein M6-a-like [Tigriopus californicus]|uniref:neuronal membrane glycoprotein M6-a-like n=1 Tax=Tigriopus californicus TaxID=6832 RepID=UPI0027DA5273|nr:neuronal membrane glycoprotein M6-a-like [Tigriopus californicus]